MGPTRWAPRRVFCTSQPDHADQPGDLCVVKFCQGRQGAAAMISEVVCRHLLMSVGVPVLDARIVAASEFFASSWNDAPGMPFKIVPGSYFGTIFKEGAIPIEDPPPVPVDKVSNLRQIIDLWATDTLVGNIDRTVFGNILMQPRKMKFTLIASDQSDCFCGSRPFSDGTWAELIHSRPAADCVFVPEAIGLAGGAQAVRVAIDKVRVALNGIAVAFSDVPGQWWQAAMIDPDQIERELWKDIKRFPRF
jgi:hypothetical protein